MPVAGGAAAAATRLSCVIVAFRRAGSLAHLLRALDDPLVERVVANVTDDPAVARVVERAGATLVPVAGNPGYAAAVNRAVAACAHDIVVFLNDDVSVDGAGLRRLALPVASGAADVAVPAVVTPAGAREPTIAALPTPGALALEWMALPDRPVGLLQHVLHVEKWRRPTRSERIRAASATVVACRRALLRQVPLPEAYFLYWEESEWFWWLARRGARVLIEPAVTVRHAGGREEVRPAKSQLLARNAVRCVRRTQGRLAAARAWPVVVLWNARLAAVDGVRALAHPGRRPVVGARIAGVRAALGALSEVL